MNKYAAYIFDLDGTLFRLKVDWSGVRAEVQAASGVELGRSSLFTKVAEIIESKPSLKGALFRTIDRYELAEISAAAPTDGALHVVSSLAESGRLAMVTMQGVAAASSVLERFDLRRHFEFLLTREDSLDRRGQLEEAVKRMGVPKRQTLFVGDKLSDATSGAAAEVDVAIVGRPGSEKWGATYSFGDLVSLARRLA